MRRMKKEYITPEVEITEFQEEEVIFMSGIQEETGDNFVGEDGLGWG